jgi:hypothetical protein
MRHAAVPPIALAALALAAGAARAADAPPRLILSPLKAGPVEAAALNAAVLAPDRRAHDLPQPGVARTAIDRSLDKRSAAALGFLCGRPDSLDERAAAQPLGADPSGRFLGARLSFAF